MTAGAGIAQESPDASGVIRGVVIDDTGLHVPGADVRVDLQDGRPRMSALPFSETDQDGAFAISRLPWGLYYVWVSKQQEDGGQVDTFFDQLHFHPETPEISATLTPGHPVAELLVTLPRPGKVSWSATDAATGKPVAVSMRVFRWLEGDDNACRLCNEEHGTAALEPNRYWILAPTDLEVGLSARADGYAVWRYPTSVRLKPGDNLVIDIKLQPLAK